MQSQLEAKARKLKALVHNKNKMSNILQKMIIKTDYLNESIQDTTCTNNRAQQQSTNQESFKNDTFNVNTATNSSTQNEHTTSLTDLIYKEESI